MSRFPSPRPQPVGASPPNLCRPCARRKRAPLRGPPDGGAAAAAAEAALMVLVEGRLCAHLLCTDRDPWLEAAEAPAVWISSLQPPSQLLGESGLHRWSISGIAAPPPTLVPAARVSLRDTLLSSRSSGTVHAGVAAEPAVRVSSWGLNSPAMIPTTIENCQIAFSHSS